jgi:hypothetical protein
MNKNVAGLMTEIEKCSAEQFLGSEPVYVHVWYDIHGVSQGQIPIISFSLLLRVRRTSHNSLSVLVPTLPNPTHLWRK